jgi:adenylate cyclase
VRFVTKAPPRPLSPPLQQLQQCFQGLMPSCIATCAPDGTPNVTYLSEVHYVDSRHVALSCQFFNKTRRNVEQNPFAHLELFDPRTLDLYRLRVRYTHSETQGPLYDSMSLRIQAIASVTGMEKIFRLIAADIYEVLEVEVVEGFLQEPSAGRAGLGTVQPEFSLRQPLGLQIVSQLINRARDLEQMLQVLLQTLDEVCGFPHAMMLVPDESGRRLVAIASRGYDQPGRAGVGAEVVLGEGFIGTVAAEQKVLRLSSVEGELRYGRAIRQRAESAGQSANLRPEIPLPGLADAQSHLALPLVVQDRLVGVLALESRDPFAFGTWDEALLQMLANQIAVVLDRNATRDDDDAGAPGKPAEVAPPLVPVSPVLAAGLARRAFTFFRNDDCVFVDGEYLIRNVPGKILWKLLNAYQRDGRTEFTNRELRLDPGLGLPPVKNNLESRLILLRRRLEEQCPDVKLVPVRRGRFALEVHCPLALVERDTA